MGSQPGSFGKGRSDLREPRHKLAAQRFMVDITFDRAGAQDSAGTTAPLRRQFDESLAQRLVRRQPGNSNVVQFIQTLLCLLSMLEVESPRRPQSLHPRVKLLRSSSLGFKNCLRQWHKTVGVKTAARRRLVRPIKPLGV